MGYNVQMQNYEGPFDLLLELLQKDKINICDISIVEITNQYMEQLRELEQVLDMEKMTVFLDMAVKLLEIKSRFLLYLQSHDEEEEEDPTEEIKRSLENYKAYRNVVKYLSARNLPMENYYTAKPQEVYIDEYLDLQNVTLDSLYEFAHSVLERKNENPIMISYKTRSLEDKIDEIRQSIESGKTYSFSDLLISKEKDDCVVTFLSILEMTHLKEMRFRQRDLFGQIEVKRVEEQNGAKTTM